MMTATLLPTRKEDWGFFGAMAALGVAATRAWDAASAMIATATGAGSEGVRDFLDSRHGRHFADDVANGLHAGLGLDAAIRAATDRWMVWRIGRTIGREMGIPAGLTYLTGFVMLFEILAEADAAA